MFRDLDTFDNAPSVSIEGYDCYKCLIKTDKFLYDQYDSLSFLYDDIYRDSTHRSYHKVTKKNGFLFTDHSGEMCFNVFSYVKDRLRYPIPGEKLFVAKNSILPRNRMQGFFQRAKAASDTISTVISMNGKNHAVIKAEQYHLFVNDDIGVLVAFLASNSPNVENALQNIKFTDNPRRYDSVRESVSDYNEAKENFYNVVRGFKKIKTVWLYGVKPKEEYAVDILNMNSIHDFVDDHDVFKLCNSDLHDFDEDFMSTCIEYLMANTDEYSTLLLHTLASMNYDKFKATIMMFLLSMNRKQRNCAGSTRTDVKFMCNFLKVDIKAWKPRVIPISREEILPEDLELLHKMADILKSRTDFNYMGFKDCASRFLNTEL